MIGDKCVHPPDDLAGVAGIDVRAGEQDQFDGSSRPHALDDGVPRRCDRRSVSGLGDGVDGVTKRQCG